MHQQNRNHRFQYTALPSTSKSMEEKQEGAARADRTAEDCSALPLDDWEMDDPPIFFDGLDFEERRVDLPCDDDGQVFLAPHRQPEELRNDDNADLLTDKQGVLAEQISVDDGSIERFEPSQREFGFKRDSDLETTIEPKLDQSPHMGFRRDAITDAFISLKAFPTSAVQDAAPDDQGARLYDEGGESQWAGKQLTLPSIETAGSSEVLTNHKGGTSQIVAPIMVAMSGIVQRTISSLGTVSQGVRASVATSGVGLRIFWAAVHRCLRMLAQKAANFATFSSGYLTIAGKAACSLGVRIGSTLLLNFRAVSISLLGMSDRLGRSAGTRLLKLASACVAKAGELRKALRLWLPIAAKACLNDTKKVISISSATFQTLTMKAIGSSIYWGRKSVATLSHLFRALGQTMSAMSSMSHVAFNRSTEVIRRTSRLLKSAGGRASESMQQNLGRGALQGAKGISFVMKNVEKNLMALGPASEKSMRIPLGGLAGVAAVVVLFVTAWSDTSKSTAPSIELAFPPKPTALQKELSHDPIIFDWPAIEVRPDESERIVSTDALPADLSLSEGRSLLSPEDALAELIEDAASVRDRHDGGSSAEGETPVVGIGNPSSDRSVRLAALTLLADLENIKNAGEFAKALRAVGLETLIQPGQPYTMLVPSNAAFAKLGQDELERLLQPSGHDQLRALLSNHILKQRLQYDDFAGAIGSHLSLANQTITIVATDVIKVGNASMIETDLWAANTVVHVIDDILVLSGPAKNALSPSVTAFEATDDT